MGFSISPPRASAAVSRRVFIAGAGVALHAIILPRHAPAQPAPNAAPSGFRVLRAQPGMALLRGEGQPPTAVWGYDGQVPGPTLRLKRGEELKIRLINELPEATLVHWHGLRIPNTMDGVPHLTQEPIQPGQSFDYRFRVLDAGTFWYHSHLYASEQIERGLAGVLIVDEPQPVDIDRDIVLVFDDWRLRPDGAVHEESFRSMHDAAHLGRIGEHLTVNGRPSLDIAVRTNERVRLRMINGANARLMALRLDKHQPMVMAIDGQPAEPFAARAARIALGPGNRVDLFVDTLLDPGADAPVLLETGTAAVPIARLVYEPGAPSRREPRGAPGPLPANPLPERMDFARALRVDVPLQGGAMRMHERRRQGEEVPGHGLDPRARIWTMAGQASSGHHGPPMFTVKRGRTVILTFPNRTAFPHAMHLHGHHFRLLDNLDDGWKPFWLDTVVVPPDQTWRIAFVADNPGKWMLHCHMLEHAETGMARWFEVA